MAENILGYIYGYQPVEKDPKTLPDNELINEFWGTLSWPDENNLTAMDIYNRKLEDEIRARNLPL
jgi:hypothetical protein